MKMVFQQKVQEKEAKLKQSEEELYARHREMKDALEKQRTELEDKKRRLESGRPLTPEKGVSNFEPLFTRDSLLAHTCSTLDQEEGLPTNLVQALVSVVGRFYFFCRNPSTYTAPSHAFALYPPLLLPTS